MHPNLGKVFGDMAQVAGVCPCCGELFYLSEVRPYYAGAKAKSFIDTLRIAEEKLDREVERLDEIESALRQAAASAGLKTAKKLLKKIDPVFSGTGYDPQDVKVMFSPVTYVVFDGLARDKLKSVTLLAKEPHNSSSERIQNSVRSAIDAGNFEFRTIHVDKAGSVTHK